MHQRDALRPAEQPIPSNQGEGGERHDQKKALDDKVHREGTETDDDTSHRSEEESLSMMAELYAYDEGYG